MPPPSDPNGFVSSVPLREVVGCFLRLGLISFGGPVAHLGYFHHEFVEKRRWLSAEDYADLVALCQFLPGPASSQVVFCLGRRVAGLPGALLASVAFLFPSASLMIALGCGFAFQPEVLAAPWVVGLQIVALAVVIQAVVTMTRQLCPDWPRRAIAMLALSGMLLVSTSWMQVVVLVLSAAAGLFWLKPSGSRSEARHAPLYLGAAGSHWAMVVFFGLLAVAVSSSVTSGHGFAGWAATYYRAGALVFGGGHVVLPWLREGMVAPGWVSESAFLAGYGAAQAVPGPLFSFAGYLGAMSAPGPWAPGWGVAALVLLFLPAWLSVYAAEPWWHRLRGYSTLRGALAGANAGVVGLLASVVLSHLAPEAVRSPAQGLLAGLAALLLWVKTPVWLVVIGCGVAAYAL